MSAIVYKSLSYGFLIQTFLIHYIFNVGAKPIKISFLRQKCYFLKIRTMVRNECAIVKTTLSLSTGTRETTRSAMLREAMSAQLPSILSLDRVAGQTVKQSLSHLSGRPLRPYGHYPGSQTQFTAPPSQVPKT